MPSSAPHVGQHVLMASPRFADRADAGRALAAFVSPAPDPSSVTFALPRGGIPVACPFAEAIGGELRPILVRKLPIPSDPEMGFGAVAIDGTVVLNRPVMAAFGLDENDAESVTDKVRIELTRRAEVFPGGWPLPALRDRKVWLVDDGLATGYTMIAAAKMIRAHSPASIGLAVPCAPADTLDRLASYVDEAWCLLEQSVGSFAVASFYRDFHELSDEEVRADLLTAAPPSTG